MRRFCLSGVFLALCLVLGALWAFRFERASNLPAWGLADLRAAAPPIPGLEWVGGSEPTALRVKVDESNPRVAARLVIPGIPAVEWLHLRFRMSARGLIPGKEIWEDGRFMVEWHSPHAGGNLETDPLASIQSDEMRNLEQFVVGSKGIAIPTLRLEHLGRAGEFELSDLEITVVKQRPVWTIGRWFLAAAWVCWTLAFVRSWPGVSWLRSVAASTIWVVMGTQMVVPGPWKIQRPMISAFQLGGASAGQSGQDQMQMEPGSGNASLQLTSRALSALGELPTQGSLILRVKLAIRNARPLLHALLFFGPTLVIAFLVGRKPALILMTTLALAIESSQIAFGYGFDRIDVLDLLTDATGIALAMLVFGRIRGLWKPGQTSQGDG
jgi:hypothetical protein